MSRLSPATEIGVHKHTASMLANNLARITNGATTTLAFASGHNAFTVTDSDTFRFTTATQPDSATSTSSSSSTKGTSSSNSAQVPGVSIHQVPLPGDDSKARVIQVQFCQVAQTLGSVLVVTTQLGDTQCCVHVFDQRAQRLIHSYTQSGPDCLRGIASDGESRIFVGSFSGALLVFDTAADKSAFEPTLLKNHTAPITALSFETEQQLLVSADQNGDVFVWLTQEGPRPKHRFNGDGVPATSVCIAGSVVYCGYMSGQVKIFQCDNSHKTEINAHARLINAIAFDKERMLLATSSEDTFVTIFDVRQPDKVSVVCSSCLKDSLLVGMQFVSPSPNSCSLALTAYDSCKIKMLHLN